MNKIGVDTFDVEREDQCFGGLDISLGSMDTSSDEVGSNLVFDSSDNVRVEPVRLSGVKKFVKVEVKVKQGVHVLG